MKLSSQALSEPGEAFEPDYSFGRARIRSMACMAQDGLRPGGERMYEPLPSGQRADMLLAAVAEQRPELHDHLSNVAELAEAVGRARGLLEFEVQWIRTAAKLHDVGKVAIADAILNKPGPLSDSEMAVMRRHTVIGERIIRSDPSLARAAELVRSSHERYDGKGYPDGLCAAEIHVGASIIAVCDAYDAMVSNRVYRKARSRSEALAELRRCAGTQFDPVIVELLCSTIDQR